MVEHLVWFKLKDGITPDEVQQLLSGMRAMTSAISVIQELSCGEDFSGRSRGFGVGLRVRFASREDGELYDQHPAHQKFIADCKHLWIDVMALDFMEGGGQRDEG